MVNQQGQLVWKKNIGSRIFAGSLAGHCECNWDTGKPSRMVVGIGGKTYASARIAYLLYHGKFPIGFMRFKDGDVTNLSKHNIYEDENKVTRYKISKKHLLASAERFLQANREKSGVADLPMNQTAYESVFGFLERYIEHVIEDAKVRND